MDADAPLGGTAALQLCDRVPPLDGRRAADEAVVVRQQREVEGLRGATRVARHDLAEVPREEEVAEDLRVADGGGGSAMG